jgi:hypothetical protein
MGSGVRDARGGEVGVPQMRAAACAVLQHGQSNLLHFPRGWRAAAADANARKLGNRMWLRAPLLEEGMVRDPRRKLMKPLG